MSKKLNFAILIATTFTVQVIGADSDIARDEGRGGGNYNRGGEGAHENYNRGGYNRYENNHYNHGGEYRHDNWNRRVDYSEGFEEGYLLNDPYNSDVQYTQPGISDNFENVYEENNEF